MQESEISLGAALESHSESPPPKPATGQFPTPVGNLSTSSPLITTELKEQMREMAIQEAKQIFANQAGLSIQKLAEDARSDLSFGIFEEPNTGLKNASYLVLKGVLTETATMGSLDRFDRNLKHWKQSPSSMDVFHQRALKSPNFVRPGATFIRENMKDQAGLLDQEKEWTDSIWTLPEFSSTPSSASDEKRYAKHSKHYRAKTEEATREPKKRRKDQKGIHRRSTSSSKSSTGVSCPSNLSRDSLLSKLTRLKLE